MRRARALAALLAAFAGACGEREDAGQDLSGFAKKPAMTLPTTYEGEGADAWAPRLSSPDAAARAEAATALGHLGAEGVAQAKGILPLLSDANPTVRWAATDALARLAPLAGDLSAPLVQRLADDDPGVRERARRGILDLGAPAGPALRGLLAEALPRVRAEAIRLLAEIGASDPAAAADLERVLLSDEGTEQEDAANALARMGAPGVEALRRALADERAEVAAWAAAALGRAGADAEPAIADLARALRRKGPPRFAAAEALVRLGTPAATAALDAALSDPDEAVRAAVRRARESR